MKLKLLPPLLVLVANANAQTDAGVTLPRPGFLQAQPAAFEANWTPLKLPTGERIALLGASYMVAMNEDWGVGPSFYGSAKGNYGGIFTVGFNAQRRWRMSGNTHLAAGLYAGAGGGLSSDRVRFGGGLMLRPELSLRTEYGNWYTGVGLAHTAFPNGRGNVRDTAVSLVLGYSDGFLSYSPADAGRRVNAFRRSGLGFDEVALSVGSYKPRSGARSRSGLPAQRIGKAGGVLRQYVTDGAWWGLEAAGAASGGADGYMEVLAALGQDYALGGRDSRWRAGWHVGTGLGGGGDVDTGNGWLVKGGPTLRWKTPWGPSLHLDAGVMGSLTGSFKSTYARFSLGLPLDKAAGLFGEPNETAGVVRTQTVYASTSRLTKVKFKDGREEGVGQLGMVLTRDLGEHLYGVAQAGSAAFGSAGAYSYGLFGLGLQAKPWAGWPRLGAELQVGAGGGGGIAIQGGAVAQAEAWAQWDFGSQDRVRLRAGVGQWRTLRGGQTQSSPLINVSLGYAFGAVTR